MASKRQAEENSVIDQTIQLRQQQSTQRRPWKPKSIYLIIIIIIIIISIFVPTNSWVYFFGNISELTETGSY